ncbi:MAG: hypothetical protein WD065_07675 [Planctomycetaceae bacterium]
MRRFDGLRRCKILESGDPDGLTEAAGLVSVFDFEASVFAASVFVEVAGYDILKALLLAVLSIDPGTADRFG